MNSFTGEVGPEVEAWDLLGEEVVPAVEDVILHLQASLNDVRKIRPPVIVTLTHTY